SRQRDRGVQRARQAVPGGHRRRCEPGGLLLLQARHDPRVEGSAPRGRDEPAATYRQAAAVDARGASIAASGLADIAAYQGRHAEALPILQAGIEADL